MQPTNPPTTSGGTASPPLTSQPLFSVIPLGLEGMEQRVKRNLAKYLTYVSKTASSSYLEKRNIYNKQKTRFHI